MYPRLSAMQIARLESVGRRRKVDRGEIIVEQGAVPSAFFVVISGELAVVEPKDGRELPFATLGRRAVHRGGQPSQWHFERDEHSCRGCG